MQKTALVVVDIQNDTTKNYKEIIDNINKSIDWAVNAHVAVAFPSFSLYPNIMTILMFYC